MAIPPRLEIEIKELETELNLEVAEDNEYINLVFKGFPLEGGFNVPSTDLLLKVPKTYPDAGPDMFWVDPVVTFADGRIPQAAENLEDHLGRQWRRFSWHRPAWNPTIDNLHGHIEFIKARLRKDE
jgi:hypothetical protein